jgi:prepilin-type N-terminal cleavage/methylation domain-containing protein
MLKITKSHAGFSLIEMAMVVAIMGVMMGGVLSIAASKQEKSATTTTVTKLDDIEESVEKFFNRYGYLPCPASPTAAEGSSTFGVATDCSSTVTSPSNTWEAGSSSDTVRGGVLPTRTLGLPDSAMYDEWGNRLGYAVIKELAVSRTNYTNFSTSATTGVIQVVEL